jgi:hypothetical protein
VSAHPTHQRFPEYEALPRNDPAACEDMPVAANRPLECLFCGEPEHADLLEVWDHDFMLQTCCGNLHEQLIYEMNTDPAWARDFLRRLAIEPLTG